MKCPRPNALAVATLVVFLSSCAPEPLEFAAWIIDVPIGTPVLEYASVPMDERDADAIRLTDELIVGADLTQPDQAVFEPGFIAGTEDGTIFVADFATTQVQMYDHDGRHARTLGREGQGPGEFASISGMTIAGDELIIDDSRNDRWSIWNLDGEHLRDQRKPEGIAARSSALEGLADGTLVVRASGDVIEGERARLRLVTRLDLEGNERARLDEMVPAPSIIPSDTWTARDVAAAFIELIGQPTRDSEVGAGNIIYITPIDEYQVVARSLDGMALWALRVAWPRPAPSPKLKSELLRRARQMDETVSEQHFDWPAGDDAIEQLRSDGRGRLYVILKTSFDGPEPDRLPTDVYDPDGTRVAAGFIPVRWTETTPRALPAWDFAAGDYAYGFRETLSGETVAVRYRLTVNER